MIKIYSFDIFDTLITRSVLNPKGIFEIMQMKLDGVVLPKEFYSDFADIRYFYAIKARDLVGYDISLERIYNFIGVVYGISDEQLQYLIRLEIETEIEYLLPVMDNIKKAEGLIENGEKVICISDMYHTENTIRKFLSLFSQKISQCDIILSWENKATKWNGDLFNIVSKKYSVDSSNFIHFGDHTHADVIMPQKHGWNAFHLPFYETKYREQFVSSERKDSPHIQIMAGLSRYISSNGSYSPVSEIGISVSGPMLFSFVAWTINEAIDSGVKRLYFLSRDGYILKQIAETIVNEHNIDIELKYLYVSRHAVLSSSYYELNDNRCFDFVTLNHPNVSLKEVASRLLLPVEELLELMKNNGRSLTPESKVDFDTAGFIRWIVTSHPDIKSKIEKKSALQRAELLKYLKTEQAYGDKTAYVDVGWNGSIQDTISFILNRENINDKSLQGLYFGVSNYTIYQNSSNPKKGYVFSPYSKVKFNHEELRLIEIFCHTNQPVVVTYSDGKPSVDSSYIMENKEFINELQHGILKFAEHASKYPLNDIILSPDDMVAYLHLLENPDIELAECIGNYMHLTGTLDYLKTVTAPKEGIIKAIKRRISGEPVMWIAGYKKRLTPLARYAFCSAKLLKKLLKG